jgi:alcohol dehydrogenase class IV
MKAKPSIIESALADACTATNPRKVDAKGIEEILDKIDIFI